MKRKIWILCDLMLVLIAVLVRLLSFDPLHLHRTGIQGQPWFWLALYLVVAIPLCFGALFWVNRIKVSPERWREGEADFKKWANIAFGVIFLVNAVLQARMLPAGDHGRRSVLSIIL